jgi:hypothetical protein
VCSWRTTSRPAKQDGVHEGEDRRVGANTKGEREDRDHAEPWGRSEGAQGVRHILADAVHEREGTRLSTFFPPLINAAHLTNRGVLAGPGQHHAPGWVLLPTRDRVPLLLMVRSRHSALIRTLVVVLLLWVGFDFGVHGLLASDFAPMNAGSSSVTLDVSRGASSAVVHPAPDHCFCHSISMGAVAPAQAAGLGPTGSLASEPAPPVPPSVPHPLDRPPQLTA